ncbi:helix-turn-helix domain-containing protein [Paenibacillus ferrarius]|uniref:helix-turn-helix domain-containing protein n=1 Tax=Paenibacillus ferrarius TaxID=1469647 RepID=UPI003D29C182
MTTVRGVTELNEGPLYFAYRRLNVNNQHKETFHSHRGTELLFIHQGRGTMIVNNISYEIKPGMLCIFQPYQLHHLQLDYSDQMTFERSVAIFEPTLFESYFEQWPALHAFFKHICTNALPAPCLYGLDDEHEIVSLFRSLSVKLSASSEAERFEEISLFLVFVFRSMKTLWQNQQVADQPYRTRQNHHVEQILNWIEQHYRQPFHLEDMANDLHLSSFHLSHLFTEAVGISITEYIATRRIHQAVLLLTSTDKPVAQIAEDIGITNCSYFCKFFKSRKGATPHQYRKRWTK